ncbi:MAG: hypothetical protein ACFNXU_03805 [Kingella sp. (in: b-proteobacteria)]
MKTIPMPMVLLLLRALKLLQKQQLFLVRIVSGYGITVMVSMQMNLLP